MMVTAQTASNLGVYALKELNKSLKMKIQEKSKWHTAVIRAKYINRSVRDAIVETEGKLSDWCSDLRPPHWAPLSAQRSTTSSPCPRD